MGAIKENAFKSDYIMWYNICVFLIPSFKRAVKIWKWLEWWMQQEKEDL